MDLDMVMKGIYDMQKQMKEIQGQLITLEKKVSTMEHKVDEGFKKVNERLERLENNKDFLAERIMKNEMELDNIRKVFSRG